jgi:hypothetical protein
MSASPIPRISSSSRPDRRGKDRVYRQRQKNGQIVVRVVVKDVDAAEFLIGSGRLTIWETTLTAKLEEALSATLADLFARWRKNQ